MEPSDTQLPATIQHAKLIPTDDVGTTPLVVPALIADLGDAAGWRYVEFFTANIRNPHTRRAYAPGVQSVLCPVRPARPDTRRNPTVRYRGLYRGPAAGTLGAGGQTTAGGCTDAVRLLITGQVLPTNPAAAVRGPKHVVRQARRRCSRSTNGASCSTPSRRRHCAICAIAR